MSVTFDVTIKPDDIVEEKENFNLIIDAQTLPGNTRLGSPSTTTVTIVDDDSMLLTSLYSVDVFQISAILPAQVLNLTVVSAFIV